MAEPSKFFGNHWNRTTDFPQINKFEETKNSCNFFIQSLIIEVIYHKVIK